MTVPMEQSGSQTIASVCSMHISVGRVTTAGVHTTEELANMPSLCCSVHTKSWQPGCAVCDVTRHCFFPPKQPTLTPEWQSLIAC